MNWTDLIAALNAAGMTDTDTASALSVKAFLGTRPVKDTEGNTLDVDAMFKAHSEKPLVVSLTRDGDRANFDAARKDATTKAADIAGRANPEPQRFTIGNAERKAYNRRAEQGRTSFSDADIAEGFGAYIKSRLGIASVDERAVLKAMTTNVNTAGGSLVPDVFVPDMISLKETRGVVRKHLTVQATNSNEITFPRRTGGPTVFFPGEGGAITASDVATNNVTVTANKMATLTSISRELMKESAISVGDLVGKEIAYAFADKEDDIAFNGTGGSTHGGMTGFRTSLTNLSGTIANIAGLVVGTANTYAGLTLADHIEVIGRQPEYAMTEPGNTWKVSKRYYSEVMLRLALAAGGVTSMEIAGVRVSSFLGYPVDFVQVMPSVQANSQVCALFGPLGLAAKAIEVSSIEIAMDESVGFRSDTIEFRGIQRFGIAVHDVGNASATAALRVAGPVVGLITAAS